jgi:hypothetical protein
MAGPSGDVAKERAGDPGEYHHSRNFTKKIAVGRRSLSESKSSCGDETSKRRISAVTPRRSFDLFLLGELRFAIRWMLKVSRTS